MTVIVIDRPSYWCSKAVLGADHFQRRERMHLTDMGRHDARARHSRQRQHISQSDGEQCRPDQAAERIHLNFVAARRLHVIRPQRRDCPLILSVSASTIDRLLVETRVAAAGGKRRRVGFSSAVRREVPVRTFNDWNDPVPGFCEIDMVAHGGTSTAGSFIQTLTMVDVATGWTECLPLLTRESGLVVQAME